MATGRDLKLTGAVGEFLVAAQLCRRGLLATPFSGNVPHYDIIASGQQGGHLVIQVKTINTGNWQFSIRQFLNVRLEGQCQLLDEPKPEPYPDLRCVLVALGDDGNPDRFFVLTWLELRDLLVAEYKQYLARHGGVRPKAPDSYHVALSVKQVENFEGQWESLVQAARPSA